jgi:hypothetical protein
MRQNEKLSESIKVENIREIDICSEENIPGRG